MYYVLLNRVMIIVMMKSGRLTDEEKWLAEQRFASCENSGWFWWLGDVNSRRVVASLDQLCHIDLS